MTGTKKTTLAANLRSLAEPMLRERVLAYNHQLESDPRLLQRAAHFPSELHARAFRIYGHVGVVASPLCLSESEYAAIRAFVEAIHAATETILDAFVAGDAWLTRHFASVGQCREFAVKQLETWQLSSRFDFVISESGAPKLLELNAGFPGGHVAVPAANHVGWSLWHGHRSSSFQRQTADELDWFPRRLIELEAQAQIEPGIVAVLQDEHGGGPEANLLCECFQRFGRTAVVADVASLEEHGGHLTWRDQRVSLTLNKIGLGNPQHGWTADYANRCRPFLDGLKRGTFLPVNNAVALALGEDKGLLACMTDRAHVDRLGLDERLLDVVAWTRRMDAGLVEYKGERRSVVDIAHHHREQMVLKPAYSLGGFGVLLGCEVDRAKWEHALATLDRHLFVLQEHVPAPRFPVYIVDGATTNIESVFQTMSAFIVGGAMAGITSRIAPNRITNGRSGGLRQPVLVS